VEGAMLRLVFNAGTEKYAVECFYVLEVIPFVTLISPSKDSDGIQGLLNYRGKLIPILDFCRLLTGKPASKLMSTRIVILEDVNQNGQTIGIIAEKVTGLIETQGEHDSLAATLCQSPYVEQIITESENFINCLNVSALYRYSLGLNKV